MSDSTTNPNPSRQSLLGLDCLNFLMADVRDGVGPYLVIFLTTSQHWEPKTIGVVMAASAMTMALCQIPAGLMVDGLQIKRLLVAIAGCLVGLGCLLSVFFPTLVPVIASQIMLGAACAIIPPALAALSLGLVGRKKLDSRVSRNEGFNHAGNLTAAVLAGVCGHYFGVPWVFYLTCSFALASAAVVFLIHPKEIDHEVARGGEIKEEGKGKATPMPMKDVLKRRDWLVFVVSLILFHFGNAAMLPMTGQVLAKKHPGEETLALSACIIVAQIVMIAVACLAGRAMEKGWGRKKIFLIAFAVLPIRGLLIAFITDPLWIVAIQVLDGIAAGLFGVMTIVMASDLTKGTGRFNLMQGLCALGAGMGTGISNYTGFLVTQYFGLSTGFLYLTAISAIALGFFAFLMPETKDVDNDDSANVLPIGKPALA